MTVALGKLVQHLNDLYQVKSFDEPAINGLQVSGRKKVRKVAFAVDGVLETFQEAVARKADLLVVHHGIFWGFQFPLRGANYNRVKTLMDNDLGLYAAHLPMDAHPQLGHNAVLLKELGVAPEALEPFGNYKGTTIGFSGKIPELSRQSMTKRLEKVLGDRVQLLPFGPDVIRSVACVTGAGADFGLVSEAKIKNIHFYISGEAAHPIYHFSRENGVNLALGGHYRTEVFGLKALQRYLEEQFQLETCFIDCPTGM